MSKTSTVRPEKLGRVRAVNCWHESTPNYANSSSQAVARAFVQQELQADR